MQYFESNKEFLKKSNNYIGNVELIDFKFEGFIFSGDTFEYEPSNLSAGGHTYEKQFYFEIIGNNPTWNQIPLIRQQLNKGKIFKNKK